MDERERDWRDAGLYDPSSPTADQRLELLSWLSDQGIGLEQMVTAAAEGQLNALAGDLALRQGQRLTIVEVARATGIDVELVHMLRRSTGLPPATDDEPVYTEHDLPMFELFAQASTVFSRDELLHLTRVMGSSLRRIAEAAGEMFLRDVEAEWGTTVQMTEVERAKANLDAVGLARAASGVFEPMFRGHLELATRTTRRARAGTDDFSTVTLAVGFVDLSGFTSRSSALSADELLDFVVRFEAAALDLVNANDGRVVKLIGDEVMFSAVDADAACRIALGLVHQVGVDAGSSARGGIAVGKVVAAGGDLYGETVNVAARIADIAIPGEVLVNADVYERATQFRFEGAGRRQLKGIAEPVRVWSLEP